MAVRQLLRWQQFGAVIPAHVGARCQCRTVYQSKGGLQTSVQHTPDMHSRCCLQGVMVLQHMYSSSEVTWLL
jgi:hypothetical protein